MNRIRIFHLYPDHLNLYGDRGNMLVLRRRAAWHGLDTEVVPVGPGQPLDLGRCDLLFMGGGQDSDQIMVAADLASRRRELQAAVEDGMVIFAVCGSYQLLGEYYETAQGEKIGGLGLINLHTRGAAVRLVGNAVIDCHLWDPSRSLVGFENHSGRTYLGAEVQPLGRIRQGFGNNGKDKTEGAVYKNVIGTYLHGSLLPKNPHLADYLLGRAQAARGREPRLAALDDRLEWQAHAAAISLAEKKRR